jgi:GNAT superfamily N-acetyltransferase
LTIVRAATIEDAAALARIANEIHAMHAAGRPSAFRADRVEVFTAERMGALVGAERQFVWVAEEDDAITGFAHAALHDEPEMPWRFGARVLELIAMAVTSARRGGGVGTRLLDTVLRAAREHQASEVRLKVWGFNEGARRFYRRHGFALLTEQLGRAVELDDR